MIGTQTARTPTYYKSKQSPLFGVDTVDITHSTAHCLTEERHNSDGKLRRLVAITISTLTKHTLGEQLTTGQNVF